MNATLFPGEWVINYPVDEWKDLVKFFDTNYKYFKGPPVSSAKYSVEDLEKKEICGIYRKGIND